MTEAEWLNCTDPQVMLKWLRGRASDRKLRLFAIACCRRHRTVLRGKKNRLVLDAAEAFADGRLSRKEVEQARKRWYIFDYPFPIRGTWRSALSCATMTHSTMWAAAETAVHSAQANSSPERERQAQAALLHDVFGNPFRPAALNPAWRTWNDATVVKIAQGMYEGRAFDRLPILADALEDAGCDNVEILGHLRGPGLHTRGCWAVDAILGKA